MLSFSTVTTTNPITANNTSIIKNLVSLLAKARRIITFNPFFAFFTLFLNYLFSSSSSSNAYICRYNYIRIYVDAWIAYSVLWWMRFNLSSISYPICLIFYTFISYLTIIFCYFILLSLFYDRNIDTFWPSSHFTRSSAATLSSN